MLSQLEEGGKVSGWRFRVPRPLPVIMQEVRHQYWPGWSQREVWRVHSGEHWTGDTRRLHQEDFDAGR